MNSVDSRIAKLQKEREDTVQQKKSASAPKSTINIGEVTKTLNASYASGFIDLVTYTTAMRELIERSKAESM